jgi:hypothetical protein
MRVADDTVDAGKVDEIEYTDSDKKTMFMDLKVTGKPEAFTG